MKTTARSMLMLVALSLFAATSYAPDFAVLLGGGSGDTKAADPDHKDWIIIESVSWSPKGAKSVSPPAPAEMAPASDASNAYQAPRKTPKPVVLSISTARIESIPADTFSKGRQLGAIRIRDGGKVLLLHDTIVTDVRREGEVTQITLNYTKIENANVPERAKAKIKAEEAGRAPD